MTAVGQGLAALEFRACRLGCFIFHNLKGTAKAIWHMMLLYILRLLPQKLEYLDVIWIEAIIFKICIENGQINTTNKYAIYAYTHGPVTGSVTGCMN